MFRIKVSPGKSWLFFICQKSLLRFLHPPFYLHLYEKQRNDKLRLDFAKIEELSNWAVWCEWERITYKFSQRAPNFFFTIVLPRAVIPTYHFSDEKRRIRTSFDRKNCSTFTWYRAFVRMYLRCWTVLMG